MIDIEYIRATLNPIQEDDSRKLKQGDHITKDIIDLLCTGKINDIQKCFSVSDGTKTPYSVECECSDCGTIINKNLSKTRLLEYIARKRTDKSLYKCDMCKDKEREEYKLLEEKRSEQMLENAERFISLYLKPGYDVSDNNEKPFVILRKKLYGCNTGRIAEYIRAMSYREFLDTPYWKIIARHVKKKAGFKCKICNSASNLNAHHRTYDNHGYELQNCEQDLICLCGDCHSAFHEGR